jgi:hypothetical protein
MRRPFAAMALAATLIAGLVRAQAQEPKPPVPPHVDPGGVAIALFGAGIDYTLPAIAARLARDGEGEPIAWDFAEGGRHPFDRKRGEAPAAEGGDATAIASLIIAGGKARLVVVRIPPWNPGALAQAVGFVSQTPARVVVVPMWSANAVVWQQFRDAAARFKAILFIAAAGEGADPSTLYPAALALDNVLTVTAGNASNASTGFGGAPRKLTGGPLAAALSARTAAALLQREPGLGIAELKRRIIESDSDPK